MQDFWFYARQHHDVEPGYIFDGAFWDRAPQVRRSRRGRGAHVSDRCRSRCWTVSIAPLFSVKIFLLCWVSIGPISAGSSRGLRALGRPGTLTRTPRRPGTRFSTGASAGGAYAAERWDEGALTYAPRRAGSTRRRCRHQESTMWRAR